MSAPTPSDASVRGRYCDGVYVQTGHTTEGEDFDRWLAEHDREVAAKALEDAAEELRRLDDGRTGGYYDAGRHIIRRLDARAERIKRGES